MKIQWLLTDITAIGSPVTAEDAILGVILARHVFVNSGIFCGREATL